MNNNELRAASEKIRDHLTQQKARALAMSGYGEMKCRYRGDDGSMCAVGCLIPEDCYSDRLETHSACQSIVLEAVLGVPVRSIEPGRMQQIVNLLSAWQHYHDHGYYAEWCEERTGVQSPSDFHNCAVHQGAFSVEGY